MVGSRDGWDSNPALVHAANTPSLPAGKPSYFRRGWKDLNLRPPGSLHQALCQLRYTR